MLQLEQLCTTLGTHRFEFTLTAASDARLAILGASGSGKSTLLNLIAGFITADSGTLMWQGESLLPVPAEKRPVVTLFQQHNLFPHLRLRQNVALGLDPGLRLSNAQWQRVDHMLERVGLGTLGQRYPRKLSGGEQQRGALARCLLRERPILLMDEPWSALDVNNRHAMIELCDEVLRESPRCTLFVTHNPDDVALFNAQAVRVEHGALHVER